MRSTTLGSRTSPTLLIAIFVVVAALRLARDVLVPMALAILLTFLLAPVVARLQRFVGRTASVIVVTSLSFLLIVALGWLVVGQVGFLADKLPEYQDQIRGKVKAVRTTLVSRFERATRTVDTIAQDLEPPPTQVPIALPEQGLSTTVPAVAVPAVAVPVESDGNSFQIIRDWIGPVLGPFGTAAVITVFVIFFLLYYDDLRDRFLRLLGVDQLSESTQALEDASIRVSRYLLMHSLINLIHGVIVGLGVYVIGLPAAVFWGILSAIARFIPYLGPILGSVLPVALGLAVFDSWTHVLVLVLFFIVLELISNNVLEPWLYGSSTGLSPIAVIVAAVFWTWLWGAPGLALSAPLTVCLVVLGQHVSNLEFLSILLSDQVVLDSKSRLYQRLVAVNINAASAVVDEELKNNDLAQVYDNVILPALVMTEVDRHAGSMDQQRADLVLEGVRELIDDCGEYPNAQQVSRGATGLEAEFAKVTVFCLPARDLADELAALMFTQLLKARGFTAQHASAASLTGELLDQIGKEQSCVLCISGVPPLAATHVRYLYRRLRARFERLPIVIGMWSGGPDAQRVAERLPSDTALETVTDLAQGCQVVERLVQAAAALQAAKRTT